MLWIEELLVLGEKSPLPIQRAISIESRDRTTPVKVRSRRANMGDSIVGFDVGNSTVKVGWFVKNRVEGIRTSRPHSADAIEEFIDLALSDRPFRSAYIATVNKPASDRLQHVLESRSIKTLRVLESDGTLFKEGYLGCGVDTPQTTGVDRLLACIAAVK